MTDIGMKDMNKVLADYQALERQTERDSEAVRIAHALVNDPPIFEVPHTLTRLCCWFCGRSAYGDPDAIRHSEDCPVTMARYVLDRDGQGGAA